MIEYISDRVKRTLEEERVREDFVREVTCEWVLNDEEELPMKGEGAALGTEEPLCG